MSSFEFSIKQTKNGIPDLEKALQLLQKEEVVAGVPAETAGERKDDSPINNAGLAYIHDNGSPSQNIPARPFLDPGIELVRDQLETRMDLVAEAGFKMDTNKVHRGLEQVALVAQNGIRAKITQGPFEPLKPATLAARRRTGFRGTRPLIRSGQLRQSIRGLVRERSGS